MALLAPATVLAQAPRLIAPHVHGEANLELAVDGKHLSVFLEAPGIGILDFERVATSAAERAAVAHALAELKAGAWLIPAAAAGCTAIAATSAAPGYAATDVGEVDAHAHHGASHGHSHGDAAHDHVHAGFTATVQWRCATPAALDYVDVKLPTRFPGLRAVAVKSVTPRGQGLQRVTAATTRVALDK